MALEIIIITLCIIGIVDSLYTAFQQQFSQLFAYCFTKTFKRVGCNEILHSKYARLFIVPNSWLGIITYVLLTIIYAKTNYFLLGALIATISLIVSYYLLYIQEFILKKFCIFCLISTTIMTIITILGWMLI
ncbi:vitamin K epoxide reductase family protein [Candidatus Woesearchaeota archaeon]|nr:vitamin K epoxide reductase family protein [Candidatus Woesearchaeota archaeon]